jgi:heptosyltransferase-2
MNKILIVGPGWVGDMVMAQSLFKALQKKYPHAEMDVLAPAWSLPLLSAMPEVSSAIVMPIQHGQLRLRERYYLGKQLREKKYDQAIVLPNSFKSALIPFFAKIPIRTGWRGEARYFLLNDMRILDKQKYPLMIERFIALGLNRGETFSAKEFLPEFKMSNDAPINIREKFSITTEKNILALCPGAEFGPAKRWPEEYYADIANQKIKSGWRVLLLGSAKDAAVTERIQSLTQQQCIDLAGSTTLQDAIDLLSLATQVVTNDSGLMHIAAALNKPLVAVYGPTSPEFTPPLNANAKIVKTNLACQPCFERECPLKHHDCMRKLLPEDIYQEMI